MKQNTFKFIRDFHHIPKKQKLSWCLIFNSTSDNPILGVALVGTDKAVDITKGYFVGSYQTPAHFVKIKPATRKTLSKAYKYVTTDGEKLILPKDYIASMYFRRIYSDELIDSALY